MERWDKTRSLWLHGPEFLIQDGGAWPEKPLKCLTDQNKALVCNTVVQSKNEEHVMPIDKYSNVHKLWRITALVILFICKLRKKPTDFQRSLDSAKVHLVKKEQQIFLAKELSFLNKTCKEVPPLVNNLNLFLDEQGIVRCRGRLNNCELLTYDMKNPVLLPKNSHLTELIINNCHEECKHMGTATTLLLEEKVTGLPRVEPRLNLF